MAIANHQQSLGMEEKEHQTFGQDLQQALNYFIKTQKFFAQRYGKTKYCALKLAEVTKSLEELRFEMDEVASKELQSKPGTFYYNQKSAAEHKTPHPKAPLPRFTHG